MSRITERGQGAPFPLLTTLTDQSLSTLTGSVWDSPDAREWVLVQNAGTALVAGNLIQGPAIIANHQNLTTVSFTAYSANGNIPASVNVTLAGTAVTANQYAGGYALVNAGTGIGQTLKIASHPAQATTTGNVVITLEDSPAVALDTSSKVCLSLNPYGSLNGTDFRTNGVIINPHTAATGQVIGVTDYAIPASTATVPSYGYIVKNGPVACLNDATTAIGLDLMPSTNTDGAVMTYVVATRTRVGVSTQAGVTTETRLITIQL